MKKQRTERLVFDVLESRNLLAVTAAVVNGDLIVRGDDLGNAVTITNTAPGTYTIAGDLAGVFTGVTDDIDIRLFGAGDALTLGTPATNFIVPDELDIRTNGGGDAITLFRVIVGDDTEIKTNGDGDAISFFGCTFNDDFDLDMNGGSDAASFLASGAIRNRFHEDAEIDLGDGINSLTIAASDFLDDVEIEGGSGVDRITVTTSFFDEDVEIELHDGNDIVSSATSTYNEEVEIDGDAGIDTVTDAGGNRFNDELELEEIEIFTPGGSFFDEIEFDDD